MTLNRQEEKSKLGLYRCKEQIIIRLSRDKYRNDIHLPRGLLKHYIKYSPPGNFKNLNFRKINSGLAGTAVHEAAPCEKLEKFPGPSTQFYVGLTFNRPPGQ